MIRAALRDLQWRRRRYVIAVLGAGLVFALGLVMSGLSNSFEWEADHVLDPIGADAWVVNGDAAGPFTALAPIPAATVDALAGQPGVSHAEAVISLRQSIGREDPDLVNLFGATPGGRFVPSADEGRDLAADGEAVVDDGLGLGVGEAFAMAGRTFTVVGVVQDSTLFAGSPNVFITVADAQAVAFQGQPVVSGVFTLGTVSEVPPGLRIVSPDDVHDEILRPLDAAGSSLVFIRVLLWVVAALIIGSLLYLSALERTRDFAVFKATGSSTASIAVGLALQAVVLSLASAVVAMVLATVIAPTFPMIVKIPGQSYLLLPVVAVVVGLIGSLSGLRRAAGVQPALAFGGP